MPAPVSIAFWLHANISVSLVMDLGSDSLEANELLLWDPEIKKEVHGPCQFFQSSYVLFIQRFQFLDFETLNNEIDHLILQM